MGIQGIVMTITSDFREGTLTVKRKCVCERESRDKRETELEEGSNRKIDAWLKIMSYGYFYRSLILSTLPLQHQCSLLLCQIKLLMPNHFPLQLLKKFENNYSSVNASRIDDEKIETDHNLNRKGQCKRIKK